MNGPLMLCYHAISERWPAHLSVTPRTFEEHVGRLARSGYRGVTLSEAIAGSGGGRTVAISFDDAYRSVFELARPILATAGFNASVFAPTAFVGTERPMSWPGVEGWLETEHRDELVPMSWDELAGLADAGWEVGSHTRTHPRLTDLAADELAAELAGSRGDIEAHLGTPCRALAYPYGAFDAGVVTAARTAGYEFAAGTLPGRLRKPASPLEWPRIVVNHADSGGRFRLKTSRPAHVAKSSAAWEVVALARRGVRRLRGGATDGR